LDQAAYTVISNKKLLSFNGSKHYLMRIKAPPIAAESKPGQFIMVKCGEDFTLRRPLSVHNTNKTGEIQLLFSVSSSGKGSGTEWLSKVKSGTQIDLLGPLGNGFSISPEAKKLLLIAGGIGIAPLRFLAEKALKLGKKVTIILGAKTGKGLYPPKLLPSDVEIILATEDGSIGRKAKVTDLMDGKIQKADQVFVCGPQAMYLEMAIQYIMLLENKPVQASLEVRMGCGVGACYTCSIKTKQGMMRVCKEGPVFNIKDIIWQEVKL